MKYLWLLVAFLIFTIPVLCTEIPPAGARSAALGTTSVTLRDCWSTLNNPAGLGTIQHLSAGIAYENRFFLKELSMRYATVVLPVKKGTVGFSMTSFGYPLYRENRYNLAFGKAFSQMLSIGMAFNYQRTRIGDGNGDISSLAGELGIQTQLHKDLLLGVHLYHPVPLHQERKNTTAEARMKLGINYSFSSSVFVVLETEKQLSRKALLKAGIEYLPGPSFFLRAGIYNTPFRPAFGIGFRKHYFQADLSATHHQTLGISSQVGLTFSFREKDKIVRVDL